MTDRSTILLESSHIVTFSLTMKLMKKSSTSQPLSASPIFVIGSAKISSLLGELQKGKVHLAIVLDEYGVYFPASF